MTYLHVDSSVLSHVCTCDRCTWRATRPTLPAAWVACALHAKHGHGDVHAVATAREAARSAARRRANGS